MHVRRAKTSAASVVLALLIISHRSGRELLSDRIAYHVCAPTIITICWNRERLVAVFASLGQPHHQSCCSAERLCIMCARGAACLCVWFGCALCIACVHPSRVWCLWEIITTRKGSVNQADWRVFDTDELLVATLLSVQIYYGKKFAPFAAKFWSEAPQRQKRRFWHLASHECEFRRVPFFLWSEFSNFCACERCCWVARV